MSGPLLRPGLYLSALTLDVATDLVYKLYAQWLVDLVVGSFRSQHVLLRTLSPLPW